MENISKKRGRPRLYEAASYGRLRRLKAKTKRGMQNYIRAGLAVSFLAKDGARYDYLLKPVYRLSILSELGRMHPSLMLSVANEICSSQMKTEKAIGFIRWKSGKGTPSLLKLHHAIESAIEKYCDRYQNVPKDEIVAALENLLLLYSEKSKAA